MRLRALAETERLAYPALADVRDMVEEHVNQRFQDSILNSLNVTVRYIPIVMPDELRAKYPARSKLRLKENLYDCAPQLKYEVFTGSSLEAQVGEFVAGLWEVVGHLGVLGANEAQVDAFKTILSETPRQVLSAYQSPTTH